MKQQRRNVNYSYLNITVMLLVCILTLLQCGINTLPDLIEKNSVTRALRGMPGRGIDNGEPNRPHTVSFSCSFSSTPEQSETEYGDTAINSAGNPIIVYNTETRFYEPRNSITPSIRISYSEYFGLGALVSFMAGNVRDRKLENETFFDYAAYLRFTKTFSGKLTLLFRPEVGLNSIQGYAEYWNSVDSVVQTATFRDCEIQFRNTIGINWNASDTYSLFGGVTLDNVPYFINFDRQIKSEQTIDTYAGFNYRLANGMAVCAYILVPVFTEHSIASRNMQVGTTLSFDMQLKD